MCSKNSVISVDRWHEACICSKSSKTLKDSSIYLVERWHLPKAFDSLRFSSMCRFRAIHPLRSLSFSSICSFMHYTSMKQAYARKTKRKRIWHLLGGALALASPKTFESLRFSSMCRFRAIHPLMSLRKTKRKKNLASSWRSGGISQRFLSF